MLGGEGDDSVSTGTRTPISIPDMYQILKEAWPGAIPETPVDDTSIVSLMALWCLETANGTAMWNNNIGNFVHTAGNGSPPGSSFQLKTSAGMMTFASWDSIQQGAHDFLYAFYHRWQSAWTAIQEGDMQGMAEALYEQGYYGKGEGLEASYAAGLANRQTLVQNTLGIS